MSGEHNTVPVQVWADVDEGIADLVRYLNTIPGVRTHASCQGTIGEGGAEPYGPQVLVSYHTEDAEMRLRREFDCTEVFMSTAYVHPRKSLTDQNHCRTCGSTDSMVRFNPASHMVVNKIPGWQTAPEICNDNWHDGLPPAPLMDAE